MDAEVREGVAKANAPKVSVCMPTYNGMQYLDEAVESVLSQSFDDFELLILDDQSKDATLERAQEYAARDARVRVSRNEQNLGLTGNWNACLREARGTYIHFLFQDDVMEQGCLASLVSLMDSDPAITISFGASIVIDENGKQTMSRRPLKGAQVLDGVEFAKKTFKDHNLYGEPSNVMFRADAAQAAGPFNEQLGYTPDWEYWIRLSALGKVGYVDECLSRFRVTGGSTTGGLFGDDGERLRRDEELFVESVSNLEALGITDKDIAAHNRSIKFRTFAKRVYFKLHK